jgi:hypothetical protein
MAVVEWGAGRHLGERQSAHVEGRCRRRQKTVPNIYDGGKQPARYALQ